MKITIIAVGKIKEKFYRDALAEYAKRLGKYCRFETIEVEDEKTPDKAGEALDNQIKEKEALRILKHVREDAHVVTLEIQGQKMDSIAFARKIEKLATYGTSHIQFIIGGSLGLHEKVSQRADEKISFSDMTFPHQLVRVLLAEQIYRGYRIISGEPYHK
ncbi:MAG: 23S rRNA (pseudouridine(1915)-N(3))-methyltransferase RlmH [Kineothrix sp.]|jgi:23S rRNA (pseudouridine1915-N3)-methyltransferase|nr:rRNA large subunit m3Psi methyltransferase RlmH [Lachnospiraceae bacterium 28-4]MCI8845715.1 23S rRNA (pseudouridine(1915)-N(3))-methyltransferase RlmH [Lachnospiraceae bacterium]MCX4343908.1 23S rRNA (pseudouridine(1915)-N(3))-methyltransferase RlmH [Kineothrix sp.]